ncbi:PREDICTED: pituitary tumor-transforming gene 1 protein-interacting protein-like, partial [Priapulus caudatus]|uniref:Pituitary tumor-transforming gene 1 protein-interacting protein-like n=1 Tax=Priapulus caudatus TaxID=37621 RepID=A0ABM1EV40_PRICU
YVFGGVTVVGETPASTTANPTLTTLTPAEECTSRNASCETCVEDVRCLYCFKDKSCKLYPKETILPGNDVCPLGEARWGPKLCWFNLKALIISMAVVAGTILVSVCCCVYCCCCRSKGNKEKYEREDAREVSRREERRQQHEMRMAERTENNDNIRRKYGLLKDGVPYQQMNNEKP